MAVGRSFTAARNACERAVHALAGGVLGDVELLGHLVVAELFEEAQPQHLAVLGRELGEGGVRHAVVVVGAGDDLVGQELGSREVGECRRAARP